MVTTVVIQSAAAATYTNEVLAQPSPVARKNALMICGPAIMTKASGRICAKLTAPASRCTYGETSPETGDGPPPRTGALTYSAEWDGLTERSRSSRARRV